MSKQQHLMKQKVMMVDTLLETCLIINIQNTMYKQRDLGNKTQELWWNNTEPLADYKHIKHNEQATKQRTLNTLKYDNKCTVTNNYKWDWPHLQITIHRNV